MLNISSIHKYLKKAVPFLFVVLTFPSISQWLNIDKSGTTFFWWFIETLFLLLAYCFSFTYFSVEYYRWKQIKTYLVAKCIKAKLSNDTKRFLLSLLLLKRISKNSIEQIRLPIPVLIYILYIIFAIIYGCIKAENYWDWKNLYNNTMIYLLPLIMFFFSIPSNLKKASHIWISFAIIAFWLLLPFMQLECPARFLFPFAFFIIFWPYYNKNAILICAIAFLCVFVFGSLGARSSAIRFIASFSFSIFILFIKYIPKIVFASLATCFIITPIILFTLGVTGQFNIFKLGEYIDVEIKVENSMKEGASETLSTDTRTFLYAETIESAIEHDYWLFGNSLSQGYYSKAFAVEDEVEGRGMRYSTEVGILNIFTCLGIIGVCIYLSIFLVSILKVFLFSQNKSLFVIALLLSFRWMFSFMEEFTYFDMNMAFLWIEIAMCNSPYFLRMNDEEFIKWAKNLLV